MRSTAAPSEPTAPIVLQLERVQNGELCAVGKAGRAVGRVGPDALVNEQL